MTTPLDDPGRSERPATEVLREPIEAALVNAKSALAAAGAGDAELSLRALSVRTLAELDPSSMPDWVADDVIAGVVRRIEGRLCGTAFFALDPGDALAWLHLGDPGQGSDAPLDRFVDRGDRVLEAVVGSLAGVWSVDAALASGRLEERPLLAALLSTHAPSDTLALCIEGELCFELEGIPDALHAPFSIHLLLEPKILAALLHGIQSADS